MKSAAWVLLLAGVLSSPAWAQSQNVFITNSAANTVSVADAGTLVLYPALPVGPNSIAVGTTPTACISDLSRNLVYVLNSGSTPATVSVINTQTYRVVNTIPVTSSGSVGGMTMSQDNRYLFIAGRNTALLEAGVFQIDLNVVTVATTTGTYVAGITSTTQAADCEVLPASVVGGSGNGPGRIYFSVTSTNQIAAINMLAAPPTAATLAMPAGPSGPTLMTRSPDSTFILAGTTGSSSSTLFQLFRINPAAAPQVDFLSVTGGSMSPAVEDVVFRELDVAPPFNVYFLGNDIPGRTVNQFTVGPSGGGGASVGVLVNTGYGLELTFDPFFERLCVSGLGFTAPASYDHYNVKTTPPSGEANSNSGGNNPRKFAWAPAPPPPVLDYVVQPAGSTTAPFQLDLRGSGFLQGSSVARLVDSAGIPFVATTTTVLGAGGILATFPAVAATHFDVSVTNNDGNVSALVSFFQGMIAVPFPAPVLPLVDLPPAPLPPVGAGYQMLSFPKFATVADLRAAATAQLGAYNPILYRIFLWEQDHYVELNSASLSPSQSLMGTGFFAISRSGASVQVTAPDVSHNATTPQRAVALTPGWNVVSQPWINGLTNTLPYNNLLVTANRDLTGTANADVSPLVTNVLYELVGGTYGTTASMVAGRAYWMLNQTAAPVYLVFTQGAVNKPLPLSAKTSMAASATPPPPPGSSIVDSGGGGGGGCGLLGGESLLVLLFLRGRGRRRLAA